MEKIKNIQEFPIRIHCEWGGGPKDLAPSEEYLVTLDYLHSDQCLTLLEKRWITIIKPRKKKDAIQKRSTKKMDVDKSSKDGKKVGKGDKNQKSSQEAKEKSSRKSD